MADRCLYIICTVVVMAYLCTKAESVIIARTGNNHRCKDGPPCAYGKMCTCEPDCMIYGNCCPEFNLNDATAIHDPSTLGQASCYVMDDVSELFVDSCPSTSTVEDTYLCHKSLIPENIEPPVVAKTSGIQFATRDCAICNGIRDVDMKHCDIKTVCDDNKQNATSAKGYTIKVDCGTTKKLCYPAISTCAKNMLKRYPMSDECHRFTSYVTDRKGIVYKNLYCAMCNNEVWSFRDNFCPNMSVTLKKKLLEERKNKRKARQRRAVDGANGSGSGPPAHLDPSHEKFGSHLEESKPDRFTTLSAGWYTRSSTSRFTTLSSGWYKRSTTSWSRGGPHAWYSTGSTHRWVTEEMVDAASKPGGSESHDGTDPGGVGVTEDPSRSSSRGGTDPDNVQPTTKDPGRVVSGPESDGGESDGGESDGGESDGGESDGGGDPKCVKATDDPWGVRSDGGRDVDVLEPTEDPGRVTSSDASHGGGAFTTENPRGDSFTTEDSRGAFTTEDGRGGAFMTENPTGGAFRTEDARGGASTTEDLKGGNKHRCSASPLCKYGKMCTCEPDCMIYGNCCQEFNPNNAPAIHDPTNFGQASCYKTDDKAELFVDSCPNTATVEEISECQNSLTPEKLTQPVVAKASGIQFATRDCAICNGIRDEDMKHCDISTNCDGDRLRAMTDDDEFSTVDDELSAVDDELSAIDDELSAVDACKVKVDCGTSKKICYPAISSCEKMPQTSDLCYRYAAYIYDARTGIIYKNLYCAMCNGVISFKPFCPDTGSKKGRKTAVISHSASTTMGPFWSNECSPISSPTSIIPSTSSDPASSTTWTTRCVTTGLDATKPQVTDSGDGSNSDGLAVTEDPTRHTTDEGRNPDGVGMTEDDRSDHDGSSTDASDRSYHYGTSTDASDRSDHDGTSTYTTWTRWPAQSSSSTGTITSTTPTTPSTNRPRSRSTRGGSDPGGVGVTENPLRSTNNPDSVEVTEDPARPTTSDVSDPESIPSTDNPGVTSSGKSDGVTPTGNPESVTSSRVDVDDIQVTVDPGRDISGKDHDGVETPEIPRGGTFTTESPRGCALINSFNMVMQVLMLAVCVMLQSM